MANRSDDKKKVRCSFCNKSQEQVRKLIAGPNVYICDECIEICSEIIQDEFDNEPSDSEINLLKPKEIKEFLDDYVIGQEQAKKVLSVPYTTIISVFWQRRILMSSFRRVISS